MQNDYLPLAPEPRNKKELMLMQPAVLAFIGDSVQTLFVRTELAYECAGKTSKLHRMAAAKINATSQAAAVKNIMDSLTEEELYVFKRCRNFKANTTAKNATVVDYKIASGFEGLIGFLYLAGEHGRLSELLRSAYKL